MSAPLSLETLRAKSAQANELIATLKHQIEQVKLASTPVHMAEKAKSLQQENEQLKKKVEELKKELEEAEAKNGSNPLSNLTNTKKPEATTEASKPEKKAAKQPEAKKQPAKQAEPVAVGDINVSKVDIRIGKIVSVKKHPEAESLYVEEIDLGEGKLRVVCSGLVKHIPIEQMENQMVVLVCNLKPTKLRGILSEAMVLCASTPEKVELLVPPAGAQIGDKVTVDGFEGEPAPELNTKNKIFDLVQVDLKTDEQLLATYKGKVLEVKGKGALMSSTLKNVPIK